MLSYKYTLFINVKTITSAKYIEKKDFYMTQFGISLSRIVIEITAVYV